MIKIQNKQIIEIDDLNNLIIKTYGRPYSFQEHNPYIQGEINIIVPNKSTDFENDTIPDELYGNKKGVSFASWLARDVKEWNGVENKEAWILDVFWKRNFYPDFQMIINDLYAKGLLSEGKYTIKLNEPDFIEVSDFDALVEKTYGKIYSFQQQDGCREAGEFDCIVPDKTNDFKNDSILEVINGNKRGVSFAAWLNRNPKEWNGDDEDKDYIYMFWERNFYPHFQMILNDLHTKGLLPIGRYIINIDW